MGASGGSCDCGCGGTVCTRWLVGGALNNKLERYQVHALTEGAYGPPERMAADFMTCRSTIDFAVDPETKALILTNYVPPHIDCGAGPGGGVVPCQRRVVPGEGTGMSQHNRSSISAAKVVKLSAGQRVIVNMVTDSVSNVFNTLAGDLFLQSTSTVPIAPIHFEHFHPAISVMPVSDYVGGLTPCKLRGGYQKNDWYDYWPWPDIEPVASTADRTPLDTTNLRTYNQAWFDGKAHQCSIEAVAEGVRPEDLTEGGDKEIYPAIYNPLGTQAAYSNPHLNVLFVGWSQGLLRSGAPSYETLDPPGSQTQVRADPAFTSYYDGVPGWYMTKVFPWPAQPYVELDFYSPSGAQAPYNFAFNFWSNPDAFQCIWVTPPEEGGGIPEPVTTKTAMTLSVPFVRRFGVSTGIINNGGRDLKPTSPTDVDAVQWQVDKLNEFWDNVVINEFQLPEFPVTATVRPRVIEDIISPSGGWRIKWLWSPSTELEGPQNGCTAPGLCDITMTVDVERGGAWVIDFEGNGSPLTANGSTTVVTIRVEEPDPDNEGEWLPVDLEHCCGEGATPDHSGWVVGSGDDRPYEVTAFAISFPLPYTNAFKNEHSTPCYEGGGPNGEGYMQIGNEPVYSFGSTFDYVQALPGFQTLKDSPYLATWVSDYPEAWAAMPMYVYGEYGYHHTRFRCCGYGEVQYPLVAAGCHPTYNINEVYGMSETKGRVKRLSNYGQLSYDWFLPWLLEW